MAYFYRFFRRVLGLFKNARDMLPRVMVLEYVKQFEFAAANEKGVIGERGEQ